MTMLRNAATEDPWGALITNTVMTARRLIMKDKCRLEFFFDELKRLATRGENNKSPAPSPAYALGGATCDAVIFLEVNYHE